MEILHDEKQFRYLSGVIKYLTKIRESTREEDIIKFEISFNGYYYYLRYEVRW